ncbi:MAG: cell division protein FtsL [Gammaproteobacteria bacterium]
MSSVARDRASIAFLVAAVMVSAIAAVYAKHESRKLFTEFQALTSERDSMEVEWGRLQLEQSSLSTHSRVEQLARGQMNMHVPPPDKVSLLPE